jgi:expansin (peptidoglycan-binding protein)
VREPLLACLLVVACSCSSASGVSREGGSDSGSPKADGGQVDSPVAAGDGSLSSWEEGVATYYDATGGGACSFDPTSDPMVAAMDVSEYANSAVCGECVTLVGPDATITVRIVDECPGCEVGHLDLSQQAFSQIAALSLGKVPIKWHVVPCAVTGPLAYRFKEGSSQYWTAIQVRNSRYPIASLEWKTGSADYQAITRESYDYFVIQSGVGTTGPFMVRVTASNGDTLEDTLPGVMAAEVVQGAAQFP